MTRRMIAPRLGLPRRTVTSSLQASRNCGCLSVGSDRRDCVHHMISTVGTGPGWQSFQSEVLLPEEAVAEVAEQPPEQLVSFVSFLPGS